MVSQMKVTPTFKGCCKGTWPQTCGVWHWKGVTSQGDINNEITIKDLSLSSRQKKLESMQTSCPAAITSLARGRVTVLVHAFRGKKVNQPWFPFDLFKQGWIKSATSVWYLFNAAAVWHFRKLVATLTESQGLVDLVPEDILPCRRQRRKESSRWNWRFPPPHEPRHPRAVQHELKC